MSWANLNQQPLPDADSGWTPGKFLGGKMSRKSSHVLGIWRGNTEIVYLDLGVLDLKWSAQVMSRQRCRAAGWTNKHAKPCEHGPKKRPFCLDFGMWPPQKNSKSSESSSEIAQIWVQFCRAWAWCNCVCSTAKSISNLQLCRHLAHRRLTTPPENMGTRGFILDVPSGDVRHSYGKWPLIVDFPMKNGDFP